MMGRFFGRNLGRLGRVLCVAIVGAHGYAWAAEEPPDWLKAAANQRIASYPKEVHAVVLLNENQVTLDGSGRVSTVSRHAVRIVTREGRDAAIARAIYQTDTGKVKDLHAWLIRPSGEVKKYGKDRVLDLALADNDVYNEVRMRSIVAGDDVESGAVFGYESSCEDKSVFTQFEWNFQSSRWPVLLSRFRLVLPASWSTKTVTFNHSPLEPKHEGSATVWELKDLPYIEKEPASPGLAALAPRLAVSVFSSTDSNTGTARNFNSWSAVSQWLTDLSTPQSMTNGALSDKAKYLTAGSKNDWERIDAISHFVQNLHYVSIQTGLGRGGGYRPHAATDVLAKSYGDCKDKANLMHALLKAIGINSYLLVIYSSDPDYVREEWPSPQQFNHCIIAVRIGADLEAPSIITHPNFGRLLIFDPTDEDTPLGDLPDDEQGSLALLVAGDAGALLRMPIMPAEANRIDRKVEGTLEADGSIHVSVLEQSVGQSAAEERRMFRHRSQPQYVKLIETWITLGATGAKVSNVAAQDKQLEGQFELKAEFTARGYGQLMQNKLLMFKPGVVSRKEALVLSRPSRKYPILIRGESFKETVRLVLPEAFNVDELPDPVKLQTSFGSYEARYEVKEHAFIFTRSLSSQTKTLPADKYTEVRKFFDTINTSEVAPVVLMRNN